MTETNIPPIVLAEELESILEAYISAYIGYVLSDKVEAERVNDWAQYHKYVGKIEAYKVVSSTIKSLNIKRT